MPALYTCLSPLLFTLHCDGMKDDVVNLLSTHYFSHNISILFVFYLLGLLIDLRLHLNYFYYPYLTFHNIYNKLVIAALFLTLFLSEPLWRDMKSQGMISVERAGIRWRKTLFSPTHPSPEVPAPRYQLCLHSSYLWVPDHLECWGAGTRWDWWTVT